MNTTEIERLEQISSFYEKGDRFDNMLIDRCIELVKRYCRVRRNALEIGCGNGYSTGQLAGFFDGLEVLDASSNNLKMVKERVSSDIICHNRLIEDFKPERLYDNIVFLHVLEHVEDPVAALKHLSSFIRDEGLIYISAPNCMSLNRRAGYLMGLLPEYQTLAPKDYVLGHRTLYTVDMMRDHCAQAGLKIVEMKGVYLKPLAESQMTQLGDEAIKAFYSLGEDVPQYCADIFAIATKEYY